MNNDYFKFYPFILNNMYVQKQIIFNYLSTARNNYFTNAVSDITKF